LHVDEHCPDPTAHGKYQLQSNSSFLQNLLNLKPVKKQLPDCTPETIGKEPVKDV
jgi:hypothetical protein